MDSSFEEKLDKIPVLNLLVRFLKKIKLPGFEGLSLYDLLEIYILGIVKGALTARAGAIAFSFFMAIFPFLLFILIVIPHIPVEGFETEFMDFLKSFLPPNTSEFFFQNIFENINSRRGGLLSSVFLLSMFLMANGVNAVFSGFENSYHQQLNRNFFRQYIYALGVAVILALLLIVTVAFFGYFQIYVIENLLDTLGHNDQMENAFWINVGKYLFFVIMVYLATATLYYFGTREGRDSRFFSVGAILTTL